MKKFISQILSVRNENTALNDLALFILRVFIGLTMAFSHGLAKMPPSEQLIAGVEAMGFPAPQMFAWLASLAEFAGGLLLAVGLLTRPSAALMAITMAVAAFVAHSADPFAKKEMALLFLFTSLFFALHGAGRWSVDSFLAKKK